MENKSNPNMRKVVSVSDNGQGREGVVMECGHWQKFPTGVKGDMSCNSYFNFVMGVFGGGRFVSCKTCAKQRREATGAK